jgi:hypothetical protein
MAEEEQYDEELADYEENEEEAATGATAKADST